MRGSRISWAAISGAFAVALVAAAMLLHIGAQNVAAHTVIEDPDDSTKACVEITESDYGMTDKPGIVSYAYKYRMMAQGQSFSSEMAISSWPINVCSLEKGKKYAFRVYGKNANGKSKYGKMIRFRATPPLTGNTVSYTVSWTADSSMYTNGYKIGYRAKGQPAKYDPIMVSDPAASSQEITGLMPSTDYIVNIWGIKSNNSKTKVDRVTFTSPSS